MAAAAADGSQQLTRWAAFSFVARLFTGATPAQLVAEEEEDVSSGGCSSVYRSVSTEDEDDDGDESSAEQLLAGDEGEDPRRARKSVVVCERSLSHGGGGQVQRSSWAHELIRRRHSTSGAVDAESSEPLVLRRLGAKRANDDVEATTVDHPFDCAGRWEKESSSSSPPLLLSS